MSQAGITNQNNSMINISWSRALVDSRSITTPSTSSHTNSNRPFSYSFSKCRTSRMSNNWVNFPTSTIILTITFTSLIRIWILCIQTSIFNIFHSFITPSSTTAKVFRWTIYYLLLWKIRIVCPFFYHVHRFHHSNRSKCIARTTKTLILHWCQCSANSSPIPWNTQKYKALSCYVRRKNRQSFKTTILLTSDLSLFLINRLNILYFSNSS